MKLLDWLCRYICQRVKPPVVEPVIDNANLGRGFCASNITPNDGTMTLSWEGSEFDDLQSEGVQNLRAVLWYFNDSSDYVIKDYVLVNLKFIVDEINAHGMIAILDYHQPMLKRKNLYTEANRDRFVSHWGQIAKLFNGYDSVVYELMNEPELADDSPMTASDWNVLAQRAVNEIRKYDAVNPIMISPHGWGKMEYLDRFIMPKDDNLILSIHYYNPKWMTVQGATWRPHGVETLGADYPIIKPFWDNLVNEFKVVEEWAAKNGSPPITIGEFGVYTPFIDERHMNNYLVQLARFFESMGYSWSYWDFIGSFGVYKNGWLKGKDALLHDPMPEFGTYKSTVLYQSDFSDIDGWTSRGASLSVSGGRLVCNVTNPGSTAMDVRVFSPSHIATKGKIYRVSYKISGKKSFCADILNNRFSWHNIYDLDDSGYSRVYTYWMAYDTNASNTIQFLLGGSTGLFYIENVLIERITLT